MIKMALVKLYQKPVMFEKVAAIPVALSDEAKGVSNRPTDITLP